MSNKQPNVILIMTDQQRYDTLNVLGARYMQTPHLDRLGTEGAILTNCFCAAPSCVPSRASLFTGRYPHSTGIYHNWSPWGDSWVKYFRDAGYHTVNIGKMHTVPFDAPCGFDQRVIVENKDRPLRLNRPHGGFYDEWDKFLANNGVRKPSRETYRAEHPEYETALGAYKWQLDERYHPDVFVGNNALWFLEQRQSESPLFMVIGFPGPHPPYDPPRRFIDLYKDADIPVPQVTEEELANQPPPHALYRQEMIRGNHDAVRWCEHPSPDQLRRLRASYAANVTLIDEMIGKILATLQKRGYLDDAIVVFTSDHGDCLGDHGHIQKWMMYDCVTRVPLILWSPSRVPRGRTVGALLQQMDLAPTLFEFAGLNLQENWEAESFTPLLSSDDGGREFVFAEHTADNILKRVSFVTMVRNREFKLVHYLDADYGELYDLRADPAETRNLWNSPEYATTKRTLLDALCDWRVRSSLEMP
jgi:arylsulfatase A-like enzyme